MFNIYIVSQNPIPLSPSLQDKFSECSQSCVSYIYHHFNAGHPVAQLIYVSRDQMVSLIIFCMKKSFCNKPWWLSSLERQIVIRYPCMQRGTQEPIEIHNWQTPKSWSEYTPCVDINGRNCTRCIMKLQRYPIIVSWQRLIGRVWAPCLGGRSPHHRSSTWSWGWRIKKVKKSPFVPLF